MSAKSGRRQYASNHGLGNKNPKGKRIPDGMVRKTWNPMAFYSFLQQYKNAYHQPMFTFSINPSKMAKQLSPSKVSLEATMQSAIMDQRHYANPKISREADIAIQRWDFSEAQSG